jgi:NAD(P)-dependent dehydrogenase (short-subunit alcohol dehydrogenase family)
MVWRDAPCSVGYIAKARKTDESGRPPRRRREACVRFGDTGRETSSRVEIPRLRMAYQPAAAGLVGAGLYGRPGVGKRRRPTGFDYYGRVAVVTGSSSGLGRRLAADLARAGAVVVGVARREERLRELVEEMRPSSPASSYRVCDLSNVADFTDLLQEVEAEHGRIDILLNIAGTAGVMRDEPISTKSLRSTLEVNFVAPFAGMVTVLPGMRRRRFGAIANMSSDDGRAPGPGGTAYAASKAALSAATESLSYEARPDGVYLHVVYPGWVPTEMGLEAVNEGGLRRPPRAVRRTEQQVSSLVLRRMNDPRLEINAAVLPLVVPFLRTLAPLTYQRLRAKR